jgi:hypothetical protein
MMTQEEPEAPKVLDDPRNGDDRWAERIARAKQAREESRRLRKGQPAGFPSRWVRV